MDYPRKLRAAILLFVLILTVAGCKNPTGSANGGRISYVSSRAQEITIPTSDGWKIFGDLYVPSGVSKGAIILLHQRDGSAGDWNQLSSALQRQGYTALAIDQRGSGRSIEGRGPKGNDAPWETGNDIAAAIDYLKDKGPAGLAGASYGANNALIYAANHPESVKSVLLYSPGSSYHGLDALDAAAKWKGPMLVIHARNDEIAGEGPKKIINLSSSSIKELKLLDGSEHGTALLNATINTAVNFYKANLK